MAAKLRIYQGAIQAAAYGTPKLRIYQGAVQILWVDEIFWGADFSSPSSIECDLTVGDPPYPSLVPRCTWPVPETLIFNTGILQSHNRTEQRIAKRRGVPEQYFASSLFIENADKFSQLESVIHTWLKQTWRVPLWPQAEIYSGSLPAGSSSIAIDTRYADFREFKFALIWHDKDNYEYVYVQSLTDSALTLRDVTAAGYQGWILIVPVLFGEVLSAARARRFKGGGALVPVIWRITDVEVASGFVADMTYDGLTVLTDPAYMAGDSEDYSHDPDIAVLDAGTGPFETVSNSDYNEVVQPFLWQPRTKAECWSLRQFLCDIKGRQAAFLVPTFHEDLVLTRPVGPGGKDLYVRNASLIEMDANTMRQYLAFRPAGSDIVIRTIVSIGSISDSEEWIEINAGTGQAFGPGDSLCWVDKVRLASDKIEMRWYGRGKLSAETPLVRVTE